MKIGIVNEGIPGLHEDPGRSRNEPLPLIACQQAHDKEQAGENEPINVDEVPRACNPNRVPIAGCGHER